MKQVVLIAHNLRSTHNVGALLRTADGLGVERVYLTGYTPFPRMANDPRLPHLAKRIGADIHKTALGAEQMTTWEHREVIEPLIQELRAAGYTIAALEQDARAVSLPAYRSPAKLALIAGREVEGIEPEILNDCDQILEIPMHGQKESFNVTIAAAIAMHQLLYH